MDTQQKMSGNNELARPLVRMAHYVRTSGASPGSNTSVSIIRHFLLRSKAIKIPK